MGKQVLLSPSWSIVDAPNLPFPESPPGIIWKESFASHGFYTWNVTVARKQLSLKITPEDVEDFVKWDTSFVWDQFPQGTDVLTLHGLSDKMVPP